MKLSKDQQVVLDAMVGFAEATSALGSRPNDVLTVGGFAGTGKSTVLGVFAEKARDSGILPAYCAPTGRAASVLRKKLTSCGVQTTKMRGMRGSNIPYCGTIHGLTKFPTVNPKGELVGFQNAPGLGDRYNLLVVDEASMVGGEMLAHLQSFGLPILAVGDHGQLPPVLDSAGLMENPNYKLEKIHRQAEGNPIIALSREIRETGVMSRKLEDGKRLTFLGRSSGRVAVKKLLLDETVTMFDKALICAYNRTRVELNRFARGCLDRETSYPVKGDLVICLKNLHAIGIMNGMRGVMLKDAEQSDTVPWQIAGDALFVDEDLRINGDWLLERCGGMCWPGFNRERPFKEVAEFNKEVVDFCADRDIDVGPAQGDEKPCGHMSDLGWPFDFGYAMTAHKAQGSGFSRVVVWLDRRPEPDDIDYRRWLYTAITRSSDRLLVIE